jgi:hypothetical protein|nr:MAG TPA: hypothetical protein [Caudoviricetes sp.]
MANEIELYKESKIADMSDINVYLAEEFIKANDENPSIYFQNSDGPLSFYYTRESLNDIDKYKAFISNCINRFRSSRTYKGYKSHLMMMGLNRSQILGNIEDGMAKIEMHHNFLTIYDITILISQHILNTVGRCTSFDIVSLLSQEHKLNNIPIVMLDETSHQLYHSTPDMYIPVSMTFGKWWELLLKYRYGITLDIAYKVIRYINSCNNNNELTQLEFYNLRSSILSWGEYNETCNNCPVGVFGDGPNESRSNFTF